MEDIRVHERRRKVGDLFEYHRRWLPFIAALFKSYVRLSSPDDALTAARKTFGHERPVPFPRGIVVLDQAGTDDEEGKRVFGDMQWGSSPGREQCCGIRSFIQGLISHVGFLTFVNDLNVLCLPSVWLA